MHASHSSSNVWLCLVYKRPGLSSSSTNLLGHAFVDIIDKHATNELIYAGSGNFFVVERFLILDGMF